VAIGAAWRSLSLSLSSFHLKRSLVVSRVPVAAGGRRPEVGRAARCELEPTEINLMKSIHFWRPRSRRTAGRRPGGQPLATNAVSFKLSNLEAPPSRAGLAENDNDNDITSALLSVLFRRAANPKINGRDWNPTDWNPARAGAAMPLAPAERVGDEGQRRRRQSRAA
jgi:hypothetical protein